MLAKRHPPPTATLDQLWQYVETAWTSVPPGYTQRLFDSMQSIVAVVIANNGRIIGRLECGRTQLEVSEELGITQSVISRLWQRFQDDGHVSRCYSKGRSPVTTPNEDQYLAVTADRNRQSTASDLSRQLSSGTVTTVST
ncbi:HTH_Tnp_Tc3_2 domain-containing protein [Trichonephila clavipes]|nr:HTH_Tnp_Tc3_2 domain-containing protein [Trichonephila clavipes]